MKKQKAQLSIEMITIVGVIILGALIFAIFYIQSINKHIPDLPDMPVLLPDEPGDFPGITPPRPEPPPVPPALLCGNGVLDAGETCETINGVIQYYFDGNYYTNPSCEDLYGYGYEGTISCIKCVANYNCLPPFGWGFTLSVSPSSSLTLPNVNVPFDLIIEYDDETYDVNVDLKVIDNLYSPSDKCSINEFPIPASGINNFYVFDINAIKDVNVSCSENGEYYFNFHGFKDNNINVTNETTFNLKVSNEPTPPINDIFALCGIAKNQQNGEFKFCINDFKSYPSNANGNAIFSIDQPDISEKNSKSPSCVFDPTHGNVCFYFGYT